VTRLLAGISRNRGLVSDRGKKFLPFVKYPYWMLNPPSPIFNWYWGFFPREKSDLGMKLATGFNVALRLRVSSTVLALLLDAFMACTETTLLWLYIPIYIFIRPKMNEYAVGYNYIRMVILMYYILHISIFLWQSSSV
jgi:hypothetical protein